MRRIWMLVCITILGSALAPISGRAQPLVAPSVHGLPHFDPAQVPPPPDYTGPTHWASLPWIRDDGDLAPKGVAPAKQLRTPADVFFIHGDVFTSTKRWNADTNDLWFNGSVGQTTIGNQASAFNSCCDIYAPRYRQVSASGATGASPDSIAALEVAYSDILRAFHVFRTRNRDRPFIIAGHGQGARLAQWLVTREVDGKPVARQLVAAYLVGHWVSRDWAAGLTQLSPCATATDTACILSWNSFADGRGDTAGAVKPNTNANDQRYLCINPVTGAANTAPSPALAHLGTWTHAADTPVDPVGPLRFTMRCGADDALYVTPISGAFDGAPDGDYRSRDFQISYMNLRQDAARRVAAFRSTGG